MAHRDAILTYLRQAGLSTPRANANIDKLLQEHAHDQAEKQRAWAESFGDTPAQQAIRSIIREAAGLIDPPTAPKKTCPVAGRDDDTEPPAPDHSECIQPHQEPDGEYTDCDGQPL